MKFSKVSPFATRALHALAWKVAAFTCHKATSTKQSCATRYSTPFRKNKKLMNSGYPCVWKKQLSFSVTGSKGRNGRCRSAEWSEKELSMVVSPTKIRCSGVVRARTSPRGQEHLSLINRRSRCRTLCLQKLIWTKRWEKRLKSEKRSLCLIHSRHLTPSCPNRWSNLWKRHHLRENVTVSRSRRNWRRFRTMSRWAQQM